MKSILGKMKSEVPVLRTHIKGKLTVGFKPIVGLEVGHFSIAFYCSDVFPRGG